MAEDIIYAQQTLGELLYVVLHLDSGQFERVTSAPTEGQLVEIEDFWQRFQRESDRIQAYRMKAAEEGNE